MKCQAIADRQPRHDDLKTPTAWCLLASRTIHAAGLSAGGAGCRRRLADTRFAGDVSLVRVAWLILLHLAEIAVWGCSTVVSARRMRSHRSIFRVTYTTAGYGDLKPERVAFWPGGGIDRHPDAAVHRIFLRHRQQSFAAKTELNQTEPMRMSKRPSNPPPQPKNPCPTSTCVTSRTTSGSLGQSGTGAKPAKSLRAIGAGLTWSPRKATIRRT